LKKIAIPVDGTKISQHFGHCQQFCLVKIDGKELLEKELIPNPGHKPGYLPRYLRELNIDCILAAGMGMRAINLFKENDIEVVTGVSGEIDYIIDQYLNNCLETDENACNH